MDGAPSSDAPDEATDAADATRPGPPPFVNVAPALHEAGHEVEDLGFAGLPDDGPVVDDHPEPDIPPDPPDLHLQVD